MSLVLTFVKSTMLFSCQFVSFFNSICVTVRSLFCGKLSVPILPRAFFSSLQVGMRPTGIC